MKIAYFDCFSGISGDMALGALLDCGVTIEALREGLSALPVDGWQIDAQPILKNGIHAVSVTISLHGVTDEDELAHSQNHAHSHENAPAKSSIEYSNSDKIPHSHEHSHHESHTHSHDNSQSKNHVYDANHAHETLSANAVGGHTHEKDGVVFSHSHEHDDNAHGENRADESGRASHKHSHSANHHDENLHVHSHENHAHSHKKSDIEYSNISENAHVHEHSHAHGEHGHSHHHESEHSHEHAHGEHGHSHEHGRSMAEIRQVIESSTLSERVKRHSLEIFEIIARAEAKMHHSTPEDVHFHEIGGVDSLLDICGVAWCLDFLQVEEIHCSALPHSTGTVNCAHGVMPVPAPATLEILRGVPFVPTGLVGEMITPTGAGIVGALSQSFGAPPAFTPHLIGCGAGKKNFADRPNLLRAIIGEKTVSTANSSISSTRSADLDGLERQNLSLLETNIDDMNPELWDHVLAQIFAAGALDAWLQNVQMKKNRPATTLSVLCDNGARNAILRTVLRETTTLGVRISEVERLALPRTSQTVETPWGEVRLKIARWHEGGIVRAAPEYDDVTRLAQQHGVAAQEVYQAAKNAFVANDFA